ALAHLDSGSNKLTFEYRTDGRTVGTKMLAVQMAPIADRSPLQLAVLVGSDSAETFDAPEGARGPGLNDLDAAVRKVRCAAYMWQAFIAEHMYRHGFGRRTFSLEEEIAPDTMDSDGRSRMTARVHVVRSKYTVAELQAREIAQQHMVPDKNANSKPDDLLDMHMEDIKANAAFDRNCAVACLTLDSHWDPESQIILGHACICQPYREQKVGLFGSHTTHAWPASAAEIVAKFLDATPTDTAVLANDCGESGEHWKAANIGIGAFLHMACYLMSAGGATEGFVYRGYSDFSRAFLAKVPGHAEAITQGDEGLAYLHRPNALGMRHDRRLAMPGDAPFANTIGPNSVGAVNDRVEIASDDGVVAIEVHVNDRFRAHLEYTAENWSRRQSGQIAAAADEASAAFPTRISLSCARLRELVGEVTADDHVCLVVRSRGCTSEISKDLRTLVDL
ncbi:hypothetical protein H4R19_000173, partial [Coemansia spiralis]